MTHDPNDASRLVRLFSELVERRLIAPDRTITISRNPLLTMRGDKFKKQIQYRKQFYDIFLSELDDDTLRFVLLHEEGHIQIGSSVPYLSFLLVALGFIGIFYFPFSLGPLYSLVYLLIAVPLWYRAVFQVMFQEEFKADLFAAARMRDGFQIARPSELARRLFDKAEEKRRSLRRKRRSTAVLLLIMLIILGLIPDYHPSYHARVEMIEKNDDGTGTLPGS
jgi:Zn-dependent protease with chaperone function